MPLTCQSHVTETEAEIELQAAISQVSEKKKKKKEERRVSSEIDANAEVGLRSTVDGDVRQSASGRSKGLRDGGERRDCTLSEPK